VPILHYRELEVWQRGIELAVVCHDLTKSFPREEIYGLTAQVRRAAVSIPSNVAEGHATGLQGRFAYHLSASSGSLAEVETQIILAQRFDYLPEPPREFWELSDELGRKLSSLRRRVAATLRK
jgi:four helix bundle protein